MFVGTKNAVEPALPKFYMYFYNSSKTTGKMYLSQVTNSIFRFLHSFLQLRTGKTNLYPFLTPILPQGLTLGAVVYLTDLWR